MKLFYQLEAHQAKSYKSIVLLLAIAVFSVYPVFSTFAENVDTQIKEKITIDRERKIFIHRGMKLGHLIFSEFGFVAVIESYWSDRFDEKFENFWGGIIRTKYLHEQEIVEFISNFVKNGGRVVFVLDRRALDKAHLFQEHFSLSMLPLPGEIKNSVIYREKTSGKFIMDGETFSPLLKGLTISLVDNVHEGKEPITISVSLVPVGNDWVYNYIDSNGIKICLSAWRRLGKGEILFLSQFNITKRGYVTTSQFFDDANIGNDQNREATKRLVEWLVGETDYALFSNQEVN